MALAHGPPAPRRRACPKREDLEFGTLLGEGAFARVLHARDASCGEEFAVKIIDKRSVQAQDRLQSVLAERHLLSTLSHPGIVQLHFAFQDDWSLYFGLELLLGGELATQIARMGVCSLEFAKFYAAEIVTILGYLRWQRVAHRDLKPENLLLTLEGHLKLADFDAAVQVPEDQKSEELLSFAGTSLYLAPELLANTALLREAFSLDLWALGCILYLMLVGHTPFHAKSVYDAFQRIQQLDYSFPSEFPHAAAQALITALLDPTPARRAGVEGLEELQSHEFFGGSQDAFAAICQEQPPIRVDRRGSSLNHGANAECFEPVELVGSFDFNSSAECTPEVGQTFVTLKHAEVIHVAARARHAFGEADDEATPLYGAAMRHDEDGKHRLFPVRDSDSSSSQNRTAPAAQEDPPRGLGSLDCDPEKQEEADCGDLLLSVKKHSWQVVAQLPVPSWRQWLTDLVLQHTLRHGEDVAICGSVVQRRFPCLKPKVLLLTDLPRLLLLDPSGKTVQQEVAFPGSGGGGAEGISNEGESFVAPTVDVLSPVNFEIRVGSHRFRCCDVNLGAEAWVAKIRAAWDLGAGKHQNKHLCN